MNKSTYTAKIKCQNCGKNNSIEIKKETTIENYFITNPLVCRYCGCTILI